MVTQSGVFKEIHTNRLETDSDWVTSQTNKQRTEELTNQPPHNFLITCSIKADKITLFAAATFLSVPLSPYTPPSSSGKHPFIIPTRAKKSTSSSSSSVLLRWTTGTTVMAWNEMKWRERRCHHTHFNFHMFLSWKYPPLYCGCCYLSRSLNLWKGNRRGGVWEQLKYSLPCLQYTPVGAIHSLEINVNFLILALSTCIAKIPFAKPKTYTHRPPVSKDEDFPHKPHRTRTENILSSSLSYIHSVVPILL